MGVLANPFGIEVDGGEDRSGDGVRLHARAGVDPLQRGQMVRETVDCGHEHRDEPLAEVDGTSILPRAFVRGEPRRTHAADDGVGGLDRGPQLRAPRRARRDVVRIHPHDAASCPSRPDDLHDPGRVAPRVGDECVEHERRHGRTHLRHGVHHDMPDIPSSGPRKTVQ